MISMRGLRIAVLGGDMREIELINSLSEQGATVSYHGCPESTSLSKLARAASSALDAVQGVKVLIAPITGTDASGNLKTTIKPITLNKELLGSLAPQALLLIGSAKETVRQSCLNLGVTVVETANDDELTIPYRPLKAQSK